MDAPTSPAAAVSAKIPCSIKSSVVKKSRSLVMRCCRWNPASAAPPVRKKRVSCSKKAARTSCWSLSRRLKLNLPLTMPEGQEELPEGSAPAKVPREHWPEVRDLRWAGESPDVRVPSFAQDLAEQAHPLRRRSALQTLVELAVRHRIVPEEIRERLWVVQICRKRNTWSLTFCCHLDGRSSLYEPSKATQLYTQHQLGGSLRSRSSPASSSGVILLYPKPRTTG